MEYYLVIKRNELSTITRMNLENFMIKNSHTQKATCYKITII